MPSEEVTRRALPSVHNFMNHAGQKFGRLLVIEYAGKRERDGFVLWKCRCDCGKEIVAVGKQLRGGKTKSCGCLMIERAKKANTTHGKKGTRVYRIWSGMQTRCFNENDHTYKDYGAKGITVCDRWRTFENFLADMGEPPTDAHSIDRFPNGKGNYEPGNCRWATVQEQADNREMLRGEQHQNSKFTDGQIIDIRRRAAAGEGIKKLAEIHGVCHTTIGRIISGKHWSHVRGLEKAAIEGSDAKAG